MSSDPIPRRVALLGLLAFAGCGFQPVYGNHPALRGSFAFDTSDSVAGFRMRERLEQRLGAPDAPRFLLRVRQPGRSSPAAVTAQGETVRFNVIGGANWTVERLDNGQLVRIGNVESFTSYAATGSTVATQAAEEDAQARLSVALADMVVSRLLILSAEGVL